MDSSFSKSRFVIWTVWVIASVFYAYQYVLRVMPNIMLDDILQQFHINAAVFGQFSGVYYIGYSLAHLPIGILLDRYGPRKVMTVCMLLTVIGLLPLLFSDFWIYPIIGRALIGIGSSCAILGVFKIIRMVFAEEKFPRMLSFSVTIGLVGAIYGGGPVSFFCESLGYQKVIQAFAILGIVLAFFTYLLIPEIKSEEKTAIISDIKEVLQNKRVIFSCLFAGLMVGPLEGFADVWGTAFFKHAYGFDAITSASLPSLIFIGMCFGAPLLSLTAEKIGNYLVTIIGAAIVMAVSFFFLLGANLGTGLISFSFILVGICCAYQILAIYTISTYVREQVAGLTTAIANMIIMIFGYLLHTIIGGVVDSLGGPQAPQALSYGILVIPISLCLGGIGFSFLLLQEGEALPSKVN